LEGIELLQSAEILKQRGMELLNQPREFIKFTGVEAADQMLNDIDGRPHAFVLACLMDQQIKAERAWIIPHKISDAVGDFSVSSLLEITPEEYAKIFETNGLHRFNNKMAKTFHRGVQKIQAEYDGNSANIWLNNPSSARVVRRFIEFHGAGIKIATMAANILAREFKVPMSDYASIDISPDVHIRRVFKRLGYIRSEAKDLEVVYTAREFNPDYPGVFDLSVWEVGRNWCRPSNPMCDECYLNEYCPKTGI
jgi:endonuclease III